MQIGPSNSLLRALSGVFQPQPAQAASAVRPAVPDASTMRTVASAAPQAIPATQPSGNPLPRGSIINIRV